MSAELRAYSYGLGGRLRKWVRKYAANTLLQSSKGRVNIRLRG